MFSTQAWLQTNPRQERAKQLYSSILHPQLWERGRFEEEALAIAADRWQPPASYQFYQPSFRQSLW